MRRPPAPTTAHGQAVGVQQSRTPTPEQRASSSRSRFCGTAAIVGAALKRNQLDAASRQFIGQRALGRGHHHRRKTGRPKPLKTGQHRPLAAIEREIFAEDEYFGHWCGVLGQTSRWRVKGMCSNSSQFRQAVNGSNCMGRGPTCFEDLRTLTISGGIATILTYLSARSCSECGIDLGWSAFVECVNELPTGDRELLSLRYEAGATIKSVAAAVGRSAEGMYKPMRRIHDALYDCVLRRLKSEGIHDRSSRPSKGVAFMAASSWQQERTASGTPDHGRNAIENRGFLSPQLPPTQRVVAISSAAEKIFSSGC